MRFLTSEILDLAHEAAPRWYGQGDAVFGPPQTHKVPEIRSEVRDVPVFDVAVDLVGLVVSQPIHPDGWNLFGLAFGERKNEPWYAKPQVDRAPTCSRAKLAPAT